MRASLLASLSLPVLLLACQGDEPGGIEASVARATLDMNPAAPDALANLDITVEIQARGQPEEVTLGEVMITAQPDCDMPWFLTLDDEIVRHLDETEVSEPAAQRCGRHRRRPPGVLVLQRDVGLAPLLVRDLSLQRVEPLLVGPLAPRGVRHRPRLAPGQ